MDNELPKRKPTRWNVFDYNKNGAYFITICTANRKQILSRIVGGDVLDAPEGDVLDAPESDAPYFPNNVELLPHGEIANKYIRQLDEFYANLRVANYVIMPDHIHIMLFVFEDENSIEKTSSPETQVSLTSTNGSSRTSTNGSSRTSTNGSSRTSTPTRQHSAVSRFVSTFKRFCNKEYGENIWQRHFYDHIIRNRKDYEEHLKYIYENPIRWHYNKTNM